MAVSFSMLSALSSVLSDQIRRIYVQRPVQIVEWPRPAPPGEEGVVGRVGLTRDLAPREGLPGLLDSPACMGREILLWDAWGCMVSVCPAFALVKPPWATRTALRRTATDRIEVSFRANHRRGGKAPREWISHTREPRGGANHLAASGIGPRGIS